MFFKISFDYLSSYIVVMMFPLKIQLVGLNSAAEAVSTPTEICAAEPCILLTYLRQVCEQQHPEPL